MGHAVPGLFLLPMAFLLGACGRAEDPFEARNAGLAALLRRQDPVSDISRKYRIPGRDGHHFYLEDLRAHLAPWHRASPNAERMARLREELAGRGIRLLFMPVPSKVETYPELLEEAERGDRAISDEGSGDRAVSDEGPGAGSGADSGSAKSLFLAALDRLGVEYVDLRPDFAAAKGRHRLYPRADTHWDGPAIELGAARLAARLKEDAENRHVNFNSVTNSDDAGGSRPRLFLRDTVFVYEGDLALKFMPPGAREKDTARVRTVRDSAGPFRDPASSPVLLFGDSFLNQYRAASAHLGAHLARAIGFPVRTVYSIEGFPRGPRAIRRLIREDPSIRVVIWVVTSRSLMEVLPEPLPPSPPAPGEAEHES